MPSVMRAETRGQGVKIDNILINRSTTLRAAFERLEQSGRGILLVLDQHGRLERTITDGDLRREILSGGALDDNIATLPEVAAITAPEGIQKRQALQLLDMHGIDHLPLVTGDGRVVGLLHRREVGHQIALSTPHMGEAEQDFVAEAFRSNWIAPLGPHVDAFERELAGLVGVGHAAAVNSGTAAIHLALRLLGVGRGDTVFCSTLTFAASANPILYQGATPVFIDSDEVSWNMCPKALQRAFEEYKRRRRLPKAVIVVNLYGQSAEFDSIIEICDAYNVPILEDAAESLGARYKGRQSGSFGKFSILSFNGNKIITTSGGGMLLSDDGDQIAKARFLATQARDVAPHYQHSELGYNYRLSNLLAGVGRGQLKVLDERVQSRRAIFERYKDALSGIDEIVFMPEPDWSYSTHWLSACTIKPGSRMDAEKLRVYLANDLIEARPVWKPMHMQPLFAGAEFFTAGNEVISSKLFEQGLCLPSGSNLTEKEMDEITRSIRSAFV